MYGRDFPRRLESAGFRVTLVRYADRLPAAAVRRHALSEAGGTATGSDIYIGEKPAGDGGPT